MFMQIHFFRTFRDIYANYNVTLSRPLRDLHYGSNVWVSKIFFYVLKKSLMLNKAAIIEQQHSKNKGGGGDITI